MKKAKVFFMTLAGIFSKAAFRVVFGIVLLFLSMWILLAPSLAPMSIFMQGTIDFYMRSFHVTNVSAGGSAPRPFGITTLKSIDDLNALLRLPNSQLFGTIQDGRRVNYSITELFGIYTENFFESRYIVAFHLSEPHTGISHRVDAVSRNGDIHISRLNPGGGGTMIMDWFIIVELDNSVIPERFNIVIEDKLLIW